MKVCVCVCVCVYYKDYKSEVEILTIHDPVVIKCTGKAIADSRDDRQWHETAEEFDAMRTGLRSKFEKNPYLRHILLSTGDYILGEANPYDSTSGIRMSVSNLKAFQQDQKPSIRPTDERQDLSD